MSTQASVTHEGKTFEPIFYDKRERYIVERSGDEFTSLDNAATSARGTLWHAEGAADCIPAVRDNDGVIYDAYDGVPIA